MSVFETREQLYNGFAPIDLPYVGPQLVLRSSSPVLGLAADYLRYLVALRGIDTGVDPDTPHLVIFPAQLTTPRSFRHVRLQGIVRVRDSLRVWRGLMFEDNTMVVMLARDFKEGPQGGHAVLPIPLCFSKTVRGPISKARISFSAQDHTIEGGVSTFVESWAQEIGNHVKPQLPFLCYEGQTPIDLMDERSIVRHRNSIEIAQLRQFLLRQVALWAKMCDTLPALLRPPLGYDRRSSAPLGQSPTETSDYPCELQSDLAWHHIDSKNSAGAANYWTEVLPHSMITDRDLRFVKCRVQIVEALLRTLSPDERIQKIKIFGGISCWSSEICPPNVLLESTSATERTKERLMHIATRIMARQSNEYEWRGLESTILKGTSLKRTMLVDHACHDEFDRKAAADITRNWRPILADLI